MILGLLVLCGLVVWQGIGEVIGLITSSGWILLTITLAWLPNLVFITESWRMVFRKEIKPQFIASFLATWIARSINSMLPVATIGGEIAKARMITFSGIRGIDATASMVVDKTVQVLAVIVWGLIGISALIYLKDEHNFTISALTGFGLLSLGALGFFLVQRNGMFDFLARVGASLVKSEKWEGLSNNARAVDETVLKIYGDHTRFWQAVIIKSIGLMVQTAEVWLACYLLGLPISLLEAVILKSLTATISDIVFIIPNAYGIQEGAYIMIGALLGLTPDFALAVSLATRIRELVVDIPGLIYWQVLEGSLLLKKRVSE